MKRMYGILSFISFLVGIHVSAVEPLTWSPDTMTVTVLHSVLDAELWSQALNGDISHELAHENDFLAVVRDTEGAQLAAYVVYSANGGDYGRLYSSVRDATILVGLTNERGKGYVNINGMTVLGRIRNGVLISGHGRMAATFLFAEGGQGATYDYRTFARQRPALSRRLAAELGDGDVIEDVFEALIQGMLDRYGYELEPEE